MEQAEQPTTEQHGSSYWIGINHFDNVFKILGLDCIHSYVQLLHSQMFYNFRYHKTDITKIKY